MLLPIQKIVEIIMQDTTELAPKELSSSKILQSQLALNPDLINQQDSQGRTLLHHAALDGLLQHKNNIEELTAILNILLTAPNIDFTLKNNKGDTALHVASDTCMLRLHQEKIFPSFLHAAEIYKFDFSMLDSGGQSVLQRAMLTSQLDGESSFNATKTVLNYISQPKLNTLSAKGLTALHYAMQREAYDQLDDLLNAGADPSIPSPKEDTLSEMLTTKLKQLKLKAGTCLYLYADQTRQTITALEKLEEKVKKIITTSRAKMNIKNAVQILAEHSIFNELPNEILIPIAAYTRNPEILTDKEAEAIATEELKAIASKYCEQ